MTNPRSLAIPRYLAQELPWPELPPPEAWVERASEIDPLFRAKLRACIHALFENTEVAYAVTRTIYWLSALPPSAQEKVLMDPTGLQQCGPGSSE